MILFKKIMMTKKKVWRASTYKKKLVLIECHRQNQTNCRKNEIRILFRSRDIQVGRLKHPVGHPVLINSGVTYVFAHIWTSFSIYGN